MALQLLVMVMMLLVLVKGELVDIKPYYSLILERHNELRRGVSPGASDMREMVSTSLLNTDC